MRAKKVHILRIKFSSRMGDGVILDTYCGRDRRPWTQIKNTDDADICKLCKAKIQKTSLYYHEDKGVFADATSLEFYLAE